jgi:DNA-binding response OmpR family regulator
MILIVEDQADTRVALVRLFRHTGWEAAGVEDGAQALEHVRESVPRVILLDLHLPRVGGFEVLAAVREDPRLAGTAVIVFSAGHAESHRPRAMEMGAQDYLVKGATRWPDLLARVEAHLPPRPEARAKSAAPSAGT